MAARSFGNRMASLDNPGYEEALPMDGKPSDPKVSDGVYHTLGSEGNNYADVIGGFKNKETFHAADQDLELTEMILLMVELNPLLEIAKWRWLLILLWLNKDIFLAKWMDHEAYLGKQMGGAGRDGGSSVGGAGQDVELHDKSLDAHQDLSMGADDPTHQLSTSTTMNEFLRDSYTNLIQVDGGERSMEVNVNLFVERFSMSRNQA
ncbi:hypothetical protein AMTR_s00038p00174450 [Amborella trichopoda]|uniref:Uncharacterized protein n=1 Tax=Amborella trichopoda TaxID=13333 RepID=U5CWU3_AMBTC|nr:hypothetical protein AMTR_s00038p00174450 [Amborella trichopoda]